MARPARTSAAGSPYPAQHVWTQVFLVQVCRGATSVGGSGDVLEVVGRHQHDHQIRSRSVDLPGGFDSPHSGHVDIHQHDVSGAVSNEFDGGFTRIAFARHHEVVHRV